LWARTTHSTWGQYEIHEAVASLVAAERERILAGNALELLSMTAPT
jgi:hypothetical protein